MSCAVDVDCMENVSSPLSEEEICEACAFVLEQEGVERTCFVSVSIVSEERIREVNAEWREQDRATDVISLECERPDDEMLGPDEPCELGDILLAPTYIERQAERFGIPVEDEFTLLLVHGMLHLLGYDHLEEDEAEEMEQREDELVALLRPRATLGHTRLTRHEGEGVL
ncbi:MAG: rRNA maturation RNase YbeY [Atopobiaceae bacterium]|nr:rRNA maturation RNase YbeY [Atopobiaceae bacterium]